VARSTPSGEQLIRTAMCSIFCFRADGTKKRETLLSSTAQRAAIRASSDYYRYAQEVWGRETRDVASSGASPTPRLERPGGKFTPTDAIADIV
jgi:hypothetical protein